VSQNAQVSGRSGVPGVQLDDGSMRHPMLSGSRLQRPTYLYAGRLFKRHMQQCIDLRSLRQLRSKRHLCSQWSVQLSEQLCRSSVPYRDVFERPVHVHRLPQWPIVLRRHDLS
jgi:hypothetical protein